MPDFSTLSHALQDRPLLARHLGTGQPRRVCCDDGDTRSDFAILTDKLTRDYDAAREQFTAATRRAA